MAKYTIMTDNGPVTILADEGMTKEQAMQHPQVVSAMQQAPVSPQAVHNQGFQTEPSFTEAAVQGAQNFPESAANYGRDIYEAASNPARTAGAVNQGVQGAVQQYLGGGVGDVETQDGEFMYNAPDNREQGKQLVETMVEPYSSMSNFKSTIANDPARLLGDFGAPLVAGAANKILKATGKLIPENLPIDLQRREMLKGIGNFDDAVVRKVTKDSLKLDLAPNRKGIKALVNMRRDVGKEIGNIIDQATEGGKKVDPLELANMLRKKADDLQVLHGTDLPEAYHKVADDILKISQSKHGGTGGTSGLLDSQGKPISTPVKLNDITPAQLQEYKKSLGAALKRHWEHMNRTQDVSTANKTQALADLYGDMKGLMKEGTEGFNASGTGRNITDATADYSRIADVEGAFKKVQSSRGRGRLVPSDVGLALAVELGARGAPGLATGIASGRHILDRGIGIAGRHLNRRRIGKDIITGPTREAGYAATQGYALGSVIGKYTGAIHNEK
jgi:hypothetical protein